MTSKIVSGMGGAPSGLLKSGTTIASKSGNDWVSYGGRRAALDPAITFWAPLNRDTQDELGAADTFTRASDGLYLPYNGADWRIAGTNAPRHEDGKLLMEPAITNKCTNYNASPDVALTNVTAGGAGTVSRVDDSAALAAAGLSKVTSGFVIEIDALGVGSTSATIAGQVANTNTHTLSAWARKISGAGGVTVRLSDNSVISSSITNTDYQRVSATGTPGLSNVVLRLFCAADSKARFVINQLEESAVVTSPIITQGAAGQRAIDALEWAGLSSFFDTAEGTMLCDFQPLFSIDDQSSSQRQGIVAVNGAQPDILYQQRSPVTEYRIVSTNGSVFPLVVISPAPTQGDVVQCAVRWTTAGNEVQVGAKHNGSWVWSATSLYTVVYPTGTVLEIAGTDLQLPMRVSNLSIYNQALTTAEIEAL